MDVSAVILAGGEGRRMGGRNKALLTLDAETFIDRQIRACAGWTDDLVVVSNDAAFAREQRTRHAVTVVPDVYPGEGPLAGLHAGLTAASRPYIWVLACDQPLADAGAATLLLKQLVQEQVLAALPLLGGRPQPLHAVYRKEAADIAKALLDGGERRLLTLLDRIAWVGVGEEEFMRHGISPHFAEDVDTPNDYDRITGKVTEQL